MLLSPSSSHPQVDMSWTEAEGRGFLKQAIMYGQYPCSKQEAKIKITYNLKKKIFFEHGVRFCSSPCNSPVSVSIPQSYGKSGEDCSNCSISCIFWGMSTIGSSVLNVEICLLLLLFGKCLLQMCRHKIIYNLGVES